MTKGNRGALVGQLKISTTYDFLIVGSYLLRRHFGIEVFAISVDPLLVVNDFYHNFYLFN